MAERRLTLVQQNDTHGYLWPHPELFWTVPRPTFRRHVGGLARAVTVVRRLRQAGPVLWVDGGDTFHGTGPVVLSRGQIVPPLLKAAGIDVMVPGNWVFAYGPDALKDFIRQSGVSALAANAETSDGSFLPAVTVKRSGGSVGLMGLTYPAETQTMPESFSRGLTFTLDVPEIQASMDRLRHTERVDLTVLLSHIGLPLDLRLAEEVHGIDVILSAHSHDRLHQVMTVGNTVVIQAGAHGSFLGVLSLTVDGPQKLSDWDYRLMTLIDEEEDPAIAARVSEALAPYQEQMNEPVGQLGSPLHRMTVLETPMDRVITDAYVAYTGADMAFSHGWRYGAPMLPGVFTRGDLYNMIPTNPDLFEAELDGHTLRDFLEKNLESVFAANPFHQKGGYVVRSSGLLMAFKAYHPRGHRIEYLAVNNQEVRPHARYRVVSAGPQALKGIDVTRKGLSVDAHQVISEYFRRHKPVVVPSGPHVIAL